MNKRRLNSGLPCHMLACCLNVVLLTALPQTIFQQLSDALSQVMAGDMNWMQQMLAQLQQQLSQSLQPDNQQVMGPGQMMMPPTMPGFGFSMPTLPTLAPAGGQYFQMPAMLPPSTAAAGFPFNTQSPLDASFALNPAASTAAARTSFTSPCPQSAAPALSPADVTSTSCPLLSPAATATEGTQISSSQSATAVLPTHYSGPAAEGFPLTCSLTQSAAAIAFHPAASTAAAGTSFTSPCPQSAAAALSPANVTSTSSPLLSPAMTATGGSLIFSHYPSTSRALPSNALTAGSLSTLRRQSATALTSSLSLSQARTATEGAPSLSHPRSAASSSSLTGAPSCSQTTQDDVISLSSSSNEEEDFNSSKVKAFVATLKKTNKKKRRHTARSCSGNNEDSDDLKGNAARRRWHANSSSEDDLSPNEFEPPKKNTKKAAKQNSTGESTRLSNRGRKRGSGNRGLTKPQLALALREAKATIAKLTAMGSTEATAGPSTSYEVDSLVFQVPEDDFGAMIGAEEEAEALPFAPVEAVSSAQLHINGPECKSCKLTVSIYEILPCSHFGLCDDCKKKLEHKYVRCPGCGEFHIIELKKLYWN